MPRRIIAEPLTLSLLSLLYFIITCSPLLYTPNIVAVPQEHLNKLGYYLICTFDHNQVVTTIGHQEPGMFLDTALINPNASITQLQRRQVVVRLLHVIKIILEKHHVTYWLDGGSLLSVYRHQGKFIPWDLDGDISITKKEFKRLWKILTKNYNKVAACNELGETCVILNMESEDCYIAILNPDVKSKHWVIARLVDKATGVYVDVFGGEASNPWHPSYIYIWAERATHESFLYPLGTGVFEGMTFPTPHNVKQYLADILSAKTLAVPFFEYESCKCYAAKRAVNEDHPNTFFFDPNADSMRIASYRIGKDKLNTTFILNKDMPRILTHIACDTGLKKTLKNKICTQRRKHC